MSAPNVSIKELDPHNTSTEESRALNRFENSMRAEQWPNDTPIPPEVTINHWRYVPWYQDHHQWAAWTDDGEAVGRGLISVARTVDNRHLADFDIDVLPEHRRTGIGTRLLSQVLDVALREERQLLLFTTDSSIPAGQAFARKLGSRVGLTSQTNQLLLEETNWGQVKEWSTRGRADRTFEFGVWRGAYPGEYLDQMITMKELINTAPTDNLEVEEFTWTRNDVREEEKALGQQGGERWTTYVRYLPTGEFAGISEVFWRPHQPDGFEQGYTIVDPKFRNRGLGQWLKAEMLLQLAQQGPSLRWIRTGNADTNESMISINGRLGFKHNKSWKTWQIDVDDVVAYLTSRRVPDPDGQSPHRNGSSN